MKRNFAILVASLMAMGSMGAAQADVLTVNGSVATLPGTTQTFGPTTNSTYVSDGLSIYDLVGNSSSASAWGNDHGTYRASSSGSGTFDSMSRFQRSLEVVNNLGGDASFALNFFIYYGGIYIDNYYGVTGSGSVGYDLKINTGATSLYKSSAVLDSNGNVSVVNALNGASLSSSGSYHSYSWGGTYVTLNLGVLGAGESKTIDFDLVSTAVGSFGAESYACGEWGYGEQPVALAVAVDDGYGGYGGYGGGTCYRSAYAGGGLGDPNNVSSTLPPGGANFQVTGSLLNQVPTPASLPLVGVGLAALGALRRRRR